MSEQIRTHLNGLLEHKKEDTLQHRDLLNALCTKFVEVNFRDQASLGEDEKLNQKQIVVLVIREVLRVAKVHNWGLCKRHDFIYVYNGKNWSLLSEPDLTEFLGKAAAKMGIPSIEAEHHRFRNELLQQFLAVSNLPEPNANTDVVLLNTQNYTLEITSKGVKPRVHKAEDFLTYILTFSYDPTAKAPIFQRFLDEVLPDQSAQYVLAEYLGYIFTSGLKLEKALILFGPGANGKSVVFEIVTALFGIENVSNYTLQSLTNDNGYYRAMIANRLVNYASEINDKLEASTFKQLVSGEPVEARLPYGRPFVINRYAKLIFNSNELPRDTEQTNAFFRRFLILPFTVTIPESRQDKTLARRIIENELSGVLNWVLDGLDRLLTHKNFTYCELAEKAAGQYRKESDSVLMFLEDNNYQKSVEPMPLQDIYTEYKSYCAMDGYRPVNTKNLLKRLEAVGYESIKRNIGKVVFIKKVIII
ncbi:phage/plasmid primase, P4 family [Xanthocytophaga agilis]|uniref:Phage/plasmid primase, P4 family n=1 Tax=Xanthocytophaga agilis TaxID=3048010 RepID=A0AAE3UHJ4_9BACT|nr:phage/plasmid primase, P4 family [Xanthocytophaga agilis]MDJ1505530.1 phage/plasmid primase, P4 family [Xanthocytophaga agilis]